MYNNLMLQYEKSYNLEIKEKTIPIKEYYKSYVDYTITEKTCKKCDKYKKNWSCPPLEDNIREIWKQYNHIKLTLIQLNYNKFITENTFKKGDIDTILNITLYNEKRKMLQTLHKKTIQDEEYREAMILSTGYCNLCPQCTREENKPCKYPKNKLYSMESLGALVSKTTEEIFETRIQWVNTEEGKIPSYLTLLLGLLY